jgi:lipoprotein-releasing system permease protein
MYKLLLCWRYLLTRYLAFACIISVMLGVGTLIVVNSVMSGFSNKLMERLHALLSDIVVESTTYDGFSDPNEKMQRIRNDPFLRDRVEAMTATMEVFAMLQYNYQGETLMKTVRVIGVDPEGRARIGGFAEHLQSEANRRHPSFTLSPEAQQHYDDTHRPPPLGLQFPPEPLPPGVKPPPDPPEVEPYVPTGCIIGWAIANFRLKEAHADSEVKEIITRVPGDDIILTTVSGARLAPVYDRFVVCDYFKSEMSEYDANYVFVPLEHLQHLRTMHNRATALQIKLKHFDTDAEPVKKALKVLFPEPVFQVSTWMDKQGPLLGAISVEKGLLNVLLFLIIAVAGFGILAIFSMIVVEKTRDIGILKALGASNGGVMNIFLGYGVLLGLVGSGLGTMLGLTLTYHINHIEKWLSHYTGQDIFPRDIYYFNEIPTCIQYDTVLLVNLGALIIAVLFSVLPALRAAMLHPVRALRYE